MKQEAPERIQKSAQELLIIDLDADALLTLPVCGLRGESAFGTIRYPNKGTNGIACRETERLIGTPLIDCNLDQPEGIFIPEWRAGCDFAEGSRVWQPMSPDLQPGLAVASGCIQS